MFHFPPLYPIRRGIGLRRGDAAATMSSTPSQNCRSVSLLLRATGLPAGSRAGASQRKDRATTGYARFALCSSSSQSPVPSQSEPQLQTPPETPPTEPAPFTSTPVLASPRNQSFSLKMLMPTIKIRAGHRLGYQPHAPP